MKIVVGCLIGFSIAVATLLLAGEIPQWLVEGAKANPVSCAVFLLWTSLCAGLLAYVPRRHTAKSL